MTDKELDEIFDAVDMLMTRGHWNFLDEILQNLTPKIWRSDVDKLVGYATITLAGKSNLPSRPRFIEECKRYHHEKGLWTGLD